MRLRRAAWARDACASSIITAYWPPPTRFWNRSRASPPSAGSSPCSSNASMSCASPMPYRPWRPAACRRAPSQSPSMMAIARPTTWRCPSCRSSACRPRCSSPPVISKPRAACGTMSSWRRCAACRPRRSICARWDWACIRCKRRWTARRPRTPSWKAANTCPRLPVPPSPEPCRRLPATTCSRT